MITVEEKPVLPASGISDLVLALLGFFQRVGYRLNRCLPKDGTERMTKPLLLASYTSATRPTASAYTGGIIYVSDGGAGAVFQGSNGSAWVNLG